MAAKKKQKKISGKAIALATFQLWLKKAPKLVYTITHSRTTFVICAPTKKDYGEDIVWRCVGSAENS